MVITSQTVPALTVRDAAAALAYYRDRLGFTVIHSDDVFGVLRRDSAEVHVWQSDDESWRDLGSIGLPVRSGAESFLARTASCRIMVDFPAGVDALHLELGRPNALHHVSHPEAAGTDFGTRQVNAVDLDGDLLTFFCWTRS